jgi:rod shape-determining protein MreD
VTVGRVFGFVIAGVLLQVLCARYLIGGWIAFDLVLVGVVFVALQAGAVGGMLAGTLGGLLQDAASGGVVGIGGLLKTLVGFMTGAFGTQFVVAKPGARAMIVGAATIVHGFMALGLQAVIAQHWPGIVWTSILQEVGINAVAGYLAFYLADAVPGAMARNRSRQRSAWGRRQW